jgi:dTDP-4-dehydrorhamnose reductase
LVVLIVNYGIPASNYPTQLNVRVFFIDKSKIKASFGVHVPDYKESLRRCMGMRGGK